MVSGQMTRGAAISMALLAIIVLTLIVLLAWPTHTWLVDLESRKRISRSRSRLDPDRAVRAVTDAIKRNLVADMRVSPSDCQIDHAMPLDLGSAPLDLRNLMPLPWASACNADISANSRLWSAPATSL
jgi:hypothetical protein